MSEAPSTTSSTNSHQDPKHLSRRQVVVVIGLSVFVAIGFLFYNIQNLSQKSLLGLPQSPFTPKPSAGPHFGLKKFSSDEEFKNYLQQNQDSMNSSLVSVGRSLALPAPVMENLGANNASTTGYAQSGPLEVPPERVSATNVQVAGIDEPDIVKTDGKQLFLSEESWSLPYPRPVPMIMQPQSAMYPVRDYQAPAQATQILAAFPPAELAKIGKIDSAGQLLLSKNILVIFGNQNGRTIVTGFDVTTPTSPKQVWQLKVQDNTTYVTARLKNDQIYLVTQTTTANSCPVMPISQVTGEQLTIACADIYYPNQLVSDANVIYTVMKLNTASGAVEKTTAVLGSTSSIVYMSENSIYLTYHGQTDMVEFWYGFLSTQGRGLFADDVVGRLAKLRSYDISNQAKMVELQHIIQTSMNTQDKDKQLQLSNDLQNKMKGYLSEHSRELEKTLIVKFNADSLSAEATGEVPGYLLNQFSLDEYKANLRVATTFGQTWTQFGRADSASDVYILDSALNTKGVVKDLGKGERIYAVRFLGDTGYVVTFKQTDPFYVLDLRDADHPTQSGELKMPGYSAYLHPLSPTRVLGVGKEGQQVKVSLFNVADPQNPQEIAQYTLDEYWSEALNNHHAFLQDAQHMVFFMPGSKGGYVFSYADDQLILKKAIDQTQVKRAVFLADHLYIVGDQGVTVLDEKDWTVVKELSL